MLKSNFSGNILTLNSQTVVYVKFEKLNTQLARMISHRGVSVNVEQVVIMLSSLASSCVPVMPPINRILFSLIWTELPK